MALPVINTNSLATNPHQSQLICQYIRTGWVERDCMASINVNRATSTLMSTAFLKSAVMIVAGSLAAQVVTSYLRNNVYDVGMKGGDAVYSVVAAMLALTVLPGQYGRPLALGSTATAVRTVLRDFEVL